MWLLWKTSHLTSYTYLLTLLTLFTEHEYPEHLCEQALNHGNSLRSWLGSIV